MTPHLETALILKTLLDAYPEKRMERETLEVYIRHLEDIPPDLLRRAVEAHIKNSQWFPRVSELRQAAGRIANTRNFDTLSPPGVDALAEQAQSLEDRFYTAGELNEHAWERLAQAFETARRPHRAEYAREKLRRLQSVAGRQE
jgi:hypothetical protein